MNRIIPVIALLSVLLPAGMASAYVASPQRGAFELKFGPYTVDLGDGESDNGSGSFSGDRMFLTTLELDWQFYRIDNIASFGVAGSVGFMQAYHKAALVEATEGVESSDYNVLNIIPFAALAVVRLDVLADIVGVPLVPYAKFGLNWYLWWMLHAGEMAESEDQKAKGGSPGLQFNPGIAFRLDALDKMSARTFDNEIGVNHSYLFFELNIAKVNGFGGDSIDLSPTNIGNTTTFQIGLCLEF